LTTNTTTTSAVSNGLSNATFTVANPTIFIDKSAYESVTTLCAGYVSAKDLIGTPAKLIKELDIPAIKDYTIYNDRVIKVEFVDGTSTKCVCDESENEFDFYTGLAFCLFKRALGKDGHKLFNKLMRAACKQLDAIDERHDEEEAEEARRREKKRKAAAKQAEKKEKARQEQIDVQAAGMLKALRDFEKEKKKHG
ncbi:MAG: hypothetical protein IKV56_02160, partial [Kiritimatiellae bacterium]|nr:hypothetical protein [Kiritimatiellia bacterium]